jgi:hypothetical protein
VLSCTHWAGDQEVLDNLFALVELLTGRAWKFRDAMRSLFSGARPLSSAGLKEKGRVSSR